MKQEDTFDDLKKEIKYLKERLRAVEKEQRMIREDILSGEPARRMQKRMLEKPGDTVKDKKRKLDEDIRIEI
jgi:predicted  nucleic acid-binding Zn-ribbon protein